MSSLNAGKPFYQYQRVQEIQGSGSIVVHGTGTTTSRFQLPPKTPFNPWMTLSRGDVAIPAGGAGRYTYASGDFNGLIKSMTWKTTSGKIIVPPINNFHQYQRVAYGHAIEDYDFKKRDGQYFFYPSNQLGSVPGFTGTIAIPATATANTATFYIAHGTQLLPTTNAVGTGGTIITPTDATAIPVNNTATTGTCLITAGSIPTINYRNPAGTAESIPYKANRHILTASPPADNTALTLNNLIYNLRDYKDSAFGVLNRDISFPEATELEIVFGDHVNNGWAWTTASATDPTSARTNIATDITITNFCLYIAVEKDPTIAEQVARMCYDGVKLIIPHAIGQGQLIAQASLQNFQLMILRGSGVTLRKLYISRFVDANSVNNSNTAKTITAYKSQLNNVDIQTQSLDCTKYEDYIWNYPYLLTHGTIYDRDQFDHNHAHIETFCGGMEDDYSGHRGLDLSKDTIKYDLLATTTNATSYYYYGVAVVDRELIISANGVEVL